MSKQTDQSELSQIVARQTRLDQSIVEAFISQMFNEIEKSLVVDSHIKVNGLGLFKVIKSGDSHRILFLGSNTPVDKTIDLFPTNDESKREKIIDKPIEEETPPFVKKEENEGFYISDISSDKEEFNLVDSVDKTNESDAVVIRNFHNSERNLNRVHEPAADHWKSNLVKTCIITLIILTLIGIGYIILSGSTIKEKDKLPQSSISITFKELDNTDTLSYSHIIIPQSDVSLKHIAKVYYGSDIYWPYIYNANKNIVNHSLIIQAGSITKVPKISVDLANLSSGKEEVAAKTLSNKIYKEIR